MVEPECDGFALPLFAAEHSWPNGLRAVLYILGLLWVFMGVGIVSDVFMGAIEVITSTKKEVRLPDGTVLETMVWNPTIANLSLMALGSSAPEILLNVIEICLLNNFYAGDLGPSTIVGSAAFNLLCIIAVCILGIPVGESRSIADINVFCVTAGFSVFAYLWLLVVLQWSSPDVITIAEAALTLAFFPVLLAAAYGADAGWFSQRKVAPERRGGQGLADDLEGGGKLVQVALSPPGSARKGTSGKLIPLNAAADGDDETKWDAGHQRASFGEGKAAAAAAAGAAAAGARGGGGGALPRRRSSVAAALGAERGSARRASQRQVAELLASAAVAVGQDPAAVARALAAQLVAEARPTRAQLRANAVRQMVGGKRVLPGERSRALAKELLQGGGGGAGAGGAAVGGAPAADAAAAAGGGGGGAKGAAAAPQVYFEAEAYCVLESAGHVELGVARVGDLSGPSEVAWRTRAGTAAEGEDYRAGAGTLMFAPGEGRLTIKVEILDDDDCEEDESFFVDLSAEGGSGNARLDLCAQAEVIIIDDDEPGEVGFEVEAVTVKENEKVCTLSVRRFHGGSGRVAVRYQTMDKSAVAGKDYERAEGLLEFENGEVKKTIQIKILDNKEYEKLECFKVKLMDLRGPRKDMHFAEHAECVVNIVDDDDMNKMVTNVTALVNFYMKDYSLGSGSYASQFREALSVEGEDGEPPSKMNYFMHAISVPWKLLFATIPPAEWGGGWVCFWCSLAWIGAVTLIVGDLASLFGCVIGLKSSVTAITIVALGTSLPDTFASMAAAKMDRSADAAVGNVTGSNSVNVFLGIGLPWTIAAIYWHQTGATEEWQERYGGPNGPGTDLDLRSSYPGGAFAVPAGSLGFSVTIFSVCACLCLGLLLARRKFLGCELGGPETPKRLSGGLLVGLWIFYVLMSTLKAYELI